MAHCNKKSKYNNGGLVARKEFKGIGSIEGHMSGNPDYTDSAINVSKKVGKATVTKSLHRNNQGGKGQSTRVDVNFPKSIRASVSKSSGNNKSVGVGYKNMGAFTATNPVSKTTGVHRKGVSASKTKDIFGNKTTNINYNANKKGFNISVGVSKGSNGLSGSMSISKPL